MPLKLPTDIADFVRNNFKADEVSQAMSVLEGAALHDGRKPDMRLLRCALVACDNTVQGLEHQVAGLAIDYRDVILAGEYELKNGGWVRTQDHSRPFKNKNSQPETGH